MIKGIVQTISSILQFGMKYAFIPMKHKAAVNANHTAVPDNAR